MGNQLCPANGKDVLENFKDMEKANQSVSDIVANILSQPNKNNEVGLNEDRKEGTLGTQFHLDVVTEKEEKEVHFGQQKGRIDREEEGQTENVVDLVLKNGWTYSGQLLDGVPNGDGEEHGLKGEIYRGQFKAGQKCGQGVYHFSSSATYRGQFQDNVMWGEGLFEFTNGDTYKGGFVNGLR